MVFRRRSQEENCERNNARFPVEQNGEHGIRKTSVALCAVNKIPRDYWLSEGTIAIIRVLRGNFCTGKLQKNNLGERYILSLLRSKLGVTAGGVIEISAQFAAYCRHGKPALTTGERKW